MTLSTLRPNDTPSGSSSVTGAASAHAALSDDSDSSYVVATGSFTVSLTNLTLPSGAVIKRLAVRMRTSRPAPSEDSLQVTLSAGQVLYADSTINWSSPTTTTWIVHEQGGITDGQVDGATLTLANVVSSYRLYEAYVDVTYVVQPVVGLSGPASTVSDTNLPTVTWGDSLDPDGGPQTKYEVRVFTSAQYGAGGFNPASSTATDESGVTASAAGEWTVDTILPDGTYRAYVRIAQTVNGIDHWSDWGYQQFTISVAVPAAPLVTAIAEPQWARFYIAVEAQPGDANTDLLEVQRSNDGGATWRPLRALTDSPYLTPVGGEASTYDYEMTLGGDVKYRARALHDYSGSYAAGAWTVITETLDVTSWWLKHPLRPELNVELTAYSQPDVTRVARRGVFQPIGATRPIIITDTRASATGTFTALSMSDEEREAIDALLATGDTLLLHGPADDGEPNRYVSIGDHVRTRGVDKAYTDTFLEALPWVEVDEPGEPILAGEWWIP